MKEASFYKKLESDKVQCFLCPATCVLSPGKIGICNCRLNENGNLVTNNYGEVVTIAVDPIEKKPLYHFYPTENILSTGANGCNFGCLNCQNFEISQKKVPTVKVPPEKLVELAQEHNSIGVAFTYTEPFIWYEYILDSAKLLKVQNLKTVIVSNGYVNKEPLLELIPFIDAFNIDLKSIETEFYKKICKGNLQPVLNTIETIAESGKHLELTYLIIPGLNDSEEQVSKWVDFVASLSSEIPIHLSAYYPDYKMDIETTTAETLEKAVSIAQKKMKYVFVGNLPESKHTNSYCPACSNLLIKRFRYNTEVVGLNASHCRKCGFDTKIIHN